MNVKYCARCKTTKDISLFYKNKARHDGLETYCKKCKDDCNKVYELNNFEKRRIQKQEYRIKNHEKISIQSKEYYLNNKEKINKRNKLNKEINKERNSVKRKEYYLNNKEKENKRNKEYYMSERATNLRLLNKYGISLEQRDLMFKNQGNRCVICQTTYSEKFCIDHCHKTGKIRGILCNKCNRGLGLFQDNSELLKRASEYVAKQGVLDGDN